MNLVLVPVFVVLLLASPLWGQESYREFERGLNLSEAQRAQMDGIKHKYVGEWRGIKNESVKKRIELRELDRSRPEGRERAEKLERDLQGLEASRQRLFRQYRGEVSAILNDEQRVRYNQFIDRERRNGVNAPRYTPQSAAPGYGPVNAPRYARPPGAPGYPPNTPRFGPGIRRGNRIYGR